MPSGCFTKGSNSHLISQKYGFVNEIEDPDKGIFHPHYYLILSHGS